MSTPTELHPTSGSVLTHPSFDRPPVQNERRRGRKKGTHSLAVARREREQARAAAERAALHDIVPALEAGAARPEPMQASAPAAPWQIRATGSPPRDPLAPPRLRHEDAVIGAALAIIEERLRVPTAALDRPQAIKEYLRLQLAGLDRESFGIAFLDVRLRLITFEVLFEGTLAHTAVHAREVARRALQLNAAAVILAHNHPSGVAEPSRADELLTTGLRQTLGLLDVRVLDHIIVAGNDALSFAERGLL